jgi:hypothetical protein
MAWAAVGYSEWQLNLVLPGYEERVQFYPRGSKPYLMCNDNKRAKNSHGSGNNSNTSDGSDRTNQGQGGNSQNQSGYGNQGNQGGGRGKQRGHQNPNANQYQGRGSGGKGKYNPPQGHNPPSNTQPGQHQGKNLAHDCVAATFDDDVFNLTDDHLEVQPLVPIREEFLHTPSTLASHHLNVTVIVQDKDRTGPASELRAAGKAVMDTANYSDNFISYDMIQKLNATHLCYPALKAITVCSGLDGQCYLNNEICDLKILFHSYDGECHSISLPMRVNRKTDIDILFSRETVNKYDFWLVA